MTAVALPPLDYRDMSIAERISLLELEEQMLALEDLTEAELFSPDFWLRPAQLTALADEAWLTAMLSGRGSGKTRVGSTWVNEQARVPGTRIHLVGRTVGDVRDVMVQGESGVLATASPDAVPEYHPSLRRVLWPNGSVAMTFSSEAPSQLRGPQAHATWADELATWRQVPDDSGATAWDHVQIGTRLGDQPKIFVTTTPKRHKVIRDLVARSKEDGRISIHYGSTLDNRANLSLEYLSTLLAMYQGTALEGQEIYGILLDTIENALWQPTDFRYGRPPAEARLVRVVAVDPAVTTGGDSTGIVTVVSTTERPLQLRRAWVTADHSGDGLSPERWAARVVEAYHEVDRPDEPSERAVVVAEKNQGGELVRVNIHQVDRTVPVALIDARGSKEVRAEAAVLAYRRNRVEHVEGLEELEDELTSWEPDSKWSPGRLDALVHGVRTVLIDDKALRPFAPGQLHTSVLEREVVSAVPGYRRERERYGSMSSAYQRERDGRA